MARYVIHITRYDSTHAESTVIPVKRVRIECDSPYMLARDLPEWVRTEVDPLAKIDYHNLVEGVISEEALQGNAKGGKHRAVDTSGTTRVRLGNNRIPRDQSRRSGIHRA